MKHLLLSILLLACGRIFSQTPYWSYNFTNGVLTDGYNNDNLTQNGSSMLLTTDRHGNPNEAINLNGDYLVGGSTGADNYSISFWTKDAVNDSNTRAIVHQFLNDYGYSILLIDGKIRAYTKFGYTLNGDPYQGSNASDITASSNIDDGIWHHVVFTARKYIEFGFNYSFEYKLYIDGIQEASDIKTVFISNANNGQINHHGLSNDHIIAMGTDANNTRPYKYENKIDNIAFYKSTLSLAQISEIYSSRPSSQIVYVDKDATGSNDGSSWSNAFISLKDATNYATVIDDQIWVADGTYSPDNTDRTAAFEVNQGVKLYGGFIGTETDVTQRDWITNPTILSGDLNNDDTNNLVLTETTRLDNSYNIVRITGDNTLIDGFTIESGNGDHSTNDDYNTGAGIFKTSTVSGDIEIRNCKIQKNLAKHSAGIFAVYTTANTPNVLIDNCIFMNNKARYGATFGLSLINGDGNFTVSNCLMVNNETVNNSFGTGFAGSAAYFDSRTGANLTASLLNCTVVNNTESGTNSVPIRSTIAVRRHGGVLNFTAANNIFENNTSEGTFGGLNTSNCPTSTSLINNVRPDIATVYCSTSGTTSTGEFYSAPMLDSNYKPTATSPLIDAGDNASVIGTTDYYGTNRILNTTVDIGAYEYDASLGINDIQLSANYFNIYPNPATNFVNVSDNLNIKSISIYNTLGQQVITITKSKIDVSNLLSGIYIVQISTINNSVKTKRLIKK